MGVCVCIFFFFKQKTAYEMRISDWSSDVCSSDLRRFRRSTRRAAVASAIGGPVHRVGRRRVQRLPHRRDRRGAPDPATLGGLEQTGHTRQLESGSRRERVWEYVASAGVAISLKKKQSSDNYVMIVIKNNNI